MRNNSGPLSPQQWRILQENLAMNYRPSSPQPESPIQILRGAIDCKGASENTKRRIEMLIGLYPENLPKRPNVDEIVAKIKKLVKDCGDIGGTMFDIGLSRSVGDLYGAIGYREGSSTEQISFITILEKHPEEARKIYGLMLEASREDGRGNYIGMDWCRVHFPEISQILKTIGLSSETVLTPVLYGENIANGKRTIKQWMKSLREGIHMNDVWSGRR